MSRNGRSAGHRWERECANHLTEVTGLDIVTARSINKHAGADLVTVIERDDRAGTPTLIHNDVCHWLIECKNYLDWQGRLDAFWEQAVAQCPDGYNPVVLIKVKHQPIGRCWAQVPVGLSWGLRRMEDWCDELIPF